MIFAVVVFGLTYFGIKISADVGVVLGAIEITVFVLLSLWLIVTAGSGNTAATFNPASSAEFGPVLGNWQGILHGMIFTFLAFIGFELSAPLGRRSNQSTSHCTACYCPCRGLYRDLLCVLFLCRGCRLGNKQPGNIHKRPEIPGEQWQLVSGENSHLLPSLLFSIVLWQIQMLA